MSQVKPTPIQPKVVRVKRVRRRLRPMSDKKAFHYRAFRILKPIYLKAHPICQMFIDCFNPSIEIHHMKGQAGNLMTDERWLRATCRRCHQWVEDHKNKARELGLILYK